MTDRILTGALSRRALLAGAAAAAAISGGRTAMAEEKLKENKDRLRSYTSTELATEAYRLLMEILGPSATLRQDSHGALLRGRVERMHRAALILTFGGGTNEIQRDIIAMLGLGMPRAPR